MDNKQEPGHAVYEDGDVFERIVEMVTKPTPSQFGSPELQALVLARAIEKLNANNPPAQREE